jgi:hypothetical protein
MGRAQLADGLYDEVTDRAEFVTGQDAPVTDRAEFVTGQDAPLLPPLCTGARLLLGITAALIAFTCLTWVAVLLGVAGWLADLIWGHPPWSFLTYIGLALAASGVIGCWYGQKA